jgi:glycerophosphoryl diester phosphodiesterase
MGYAPENTLLSIQKAIDLEVDWVEIDVHFIDGELIVIHDKTLDRTTNGKGDLSDYSFEELRAFDAGQGERIPTLQEVIDMTKGKVGLNIELQGKEIALPAVDVLAKLDDTHKENIILSSFSMGELAQVMQIESSIKLGVLTDEGNDSAFIWANKLNAYSLHISKQAITKQTVKRAHDASLQVYVFTVNSRAETCRMRELGVDGLFSDYPDRVLQA